MPVYEVVMQGILVNTSTGDYDEHYSYEGYVDYEGTADQLAAEVLADLKQSGYRLAPTKEMKDEDISKVRVGIRGEGIGSQETSETE
jgi:hypothetical protein